MSVSKQTLEAKIDGFLDNAMTIETTTSVPVLSNPKPTLNWTDGLKFHAAILYIDLRWSTKLFSTHYDNVIAKILMSYYKWITLIVQDFWWEIRSFNGDSLLVFFYWNTKDAINSATKCGMKISYFIKYILNPKLENKWYTAIDFWIWIDHDEILTVKVGTTASGGADNKDLIWISKAVNLSAKISDFGSSPNNIWISSKIHTNLSDETRYHSTVDQFWNTKNVDMWDYQYKNINGEYYSVYKTSYYWSIS